MRAIVWMSPESPLSTALCERLRVEVEIVRSADKLGEGLSRGGVAFIDDTTLPYLEGYTPPGPVVVLCSDNALATAVGWLPRFPWLSHVLSGSMLQHPLAAEHLENVIDAVTRTDKPRLIEWLAPQIAGRRVRLAHAARRAERIERMGDFLEGKGIGSRQVQMLRDAAEELLTNAFYDAPVAAGALSQPRRITY